MDSTAIPSCEICGRERYMSEPWILLVESRWQDRLKILEWDDRLAAQPGVHCACGAAHVQELVVHWMTAGSLDYPMAQFNPPRHNRVRLQPSAGLPEIDMREHRQLGELSVHRDSLKRVLKENPYCLTAILDALLEALEGRPAAKGSTDEFEADLCLSGREM